MKNLKLSQELNRRINLPLSEYVRIMIDGLFSLKGNGKMNLKNDITSIDAEVSFLDSNDLTDSELEIVFSDNFQNTHEYQEECSTLEQQLNTVTI